MRNASPFRDWPQHRSNCHPPSRTRSYTSTTIATPPSAEPEYTSVEAILFSANEDRPTTVTVRCRQFQPGGCPLPVLQPYFDAPPESIILTQGLNGEPLRFPLHIFYSRSALTRASPINRPIYHITSGVASKQWYGNVVVLKFNGGQRQRYTDANNKDLGPLTAYFLSYQ
ncbi:Hif prolyl hydroxylase [Mycena sanguinolenta]|uniref:Hif prolyl hydroxylase n=1 Tax=Mycena sanguinolenta TaxID=230812 RepID=A0A8H6Z881_9AGAR|nr:Hif prolyl hydroxylase [Mycena sanguinolenta]